MIDWRLTCSWRWIPATAKDLDLTFDKHGSLLERVKSARDFKYLIVLDKGEAPHEEGNTTTKQTTLF
jgi:hypothetical protein